MSREIFEFVVIKTHVLKVHVHCHGCAHQVKKLLRRIEGVYEVTIDAEEQKVTVTGNVDSSMLITKLAKSRKHAELWPSNHSENQELINWPEDDKGLDQMQNLTASSYFSNPQPLLVPPLNEETDQQGIEKYLNRGLETEFLSGEREKNSGEMYHEILDWDDNIVKYAGHAEGKISSGNGTSIQGQNLGFAGMEGQEISQLQNLYTGIPGDGYRYPSPYPAPMLINNMQGQWYNQPYPALILRQHAGHAFS